MSNYLSALLVTLLSTAVAIGMMSLLVTKDFFLPNSFRAVENKKLAFVFASTWVLGCTGICVTAVSFLLRAAISGAGNSGVPGYWSSQSALARAILILLAGMFVWVVSVIIDRWNYFQLIQEQSLQFFHEGAQKLNENSVDATIEVALRNPKSPVAGVFAAGLHELRYDSDGITRDQIGSAKRAMEREAAVVHERLKRGLKSLAVIISVAPFIGLLGTVVGITAAFQRIGTQGRPGIDVVAGGVAEALITTAFGLLVAIPAVVAYRYFSAKIKTLDEEMDDMSNTLLARFESGYGQGAR